MAELILPEDLPKWVPGEVLLDSAGLGWQGASLRKYHYSGLEVEVPPMRDFMLVAYDVGQTRMNRQIDGPWTTEEIRPGHVSLLTRAERSWWSWNRHIDVVHLYLTADLMSRTCADIYDRDIDDVRLRDVLKADDESLRHAIVQVAREVRAGGLGGRLLVDTLATQISIHILRRFAEVSFREARVTGGFSQQQARQIIRFVEENLDQTLSLDMLAATACVSASHFLRQFKRTFGCAPHCYVIKRRMERARQLLAKTDMRLKEVAAACGFADQSHMTRLFQKMVSATPHAYRQSLR